MSAPMMMHAHPAREAALPCTRCARQKPFIPCRIFLPAGMSTQPVAMNPPPIITWTASVANAAVAITSSFFLGARASAEPHTQ